MKPIVDRDGTDEEDFCCLHVLFADRPLRR